jgi:hypothetical protein
MHSSLFVLAMDIFALCVCLFFTLFDCGPSKEFGRNEREATANIWNSFSRSVHPFPVHQAHIHSFEMICLYLMMMNVSSHIDKEIMLFFKC